MATWLTPAELFRLTGKKRYGAQRRWLDANGYRDRYTVAASGEPLVRQVDLDRKEGKARNSTPHRWDRIGNVAEIATLTRARRT